MTLNLVGTQPLSLSTSCSRTLIRLILNTYLIVTAYLNRVTCITVEFDTHNANQVPIFNGPNCIDSGFDSAFDSHVVAVENLQ